MDSSDLVAPFQGERYAAVERLSRLIAPPYDVIDAGERAQLAALDEHNIVHVMLPEAPNGRPPGALRGGGGAALRVAPTRRPDARSGARAVCARAGLHATERRPANAVRCVRSRQGGGLRAAPHPST